MYKIVQTEEANGINLCVVPHKWEKEGILYWPPGRNGKNLRKDKHSQPEETWSKQKCIVKRNYIPTFLEACTIEQQLSKFSDTEDEENYLRRKLLERKHPVHSQGYADFNNLMTTKDSKEVIMESQAESIQDVYTLDIDPDGVLHLPQDGHSGNELKVITEQLDKVLKTRQNLETEIAGLHIKFDKLIDLLVAQNVTTASTTQEQNQDYSFQSLLPISSEENLETLDKKLRDKDFETQFIKFMTQIGGTDGNKVGIKIGYLLADKIFDRGFVTMCSWTGSSKKDVRKIPFVKFSRLIETIFKIIHLAVSRYTMQDNNEFLRRILKNSGSRFTQMMAKKSKQNQSIGNVNLDIEQDENLNVEEHE